jgi:hypothetical protein
MLELMKNLESSFEESNQLRSALGLKSSPLASEVYISLINSVTVMRTVEDSLIGSSSLNERLHAISKALQCREQ